MNPSPLPLTEMFGRMDWRRFLPPLDELIDCILSQSTNDDNRDRAFAALKEAFPTWEAVMNAPTEAVIAAIKPAGLANQKAPRIQEVLRRIYAERGELNIDFLGDLPDARSESLADQLQRRGSQDGGDCAVFCLPPPRLPGRYAHPSRRAADRLSAAGHQRGQSAPGHGSDCAARRLLCFPPQSDPAGARSLPGASPPLRSLPVNALL